MNVVYVLRTDAVYDKNTQKHFIYGITAKNRFGKVLKTVPNLFLNKQRAMSFVRLCNTERLELVHLLDVCRDQQA